MRCLLLIDGSGNVVLTDADDRARVTVSGQTHPSRREKATTAVWSPDGQWTAWSLEADSPDGLHEVRVHDERTSAVGVLAESTRAFYLCPSPGGRYLSHLSPGPLGLELAVSEIRTGEVTVIERGQPLFWAWSPDSRQIAVHVENRVIVAAVDGNGTEVITEDAGSFVAPAWTADGSIVFVGDGRLQKWSPGERASIPVAPPGTGRFAVDPAGRSVALVDRIEGEPCLVVFDLATGDGELVAPDQPIAFCWSPDGRRLASLRAASPRELQWIVYQDAEIVRLPLFRPGPVWLRSVLPFFEQYTQSHPIWSADSDYLVAPTVDGAGDPAAVIHSVDDPTAQTYLPDCHLAWWANE